MSRIMAGRQIAIIAGGTGSAKLVRGLASIIPQERLVVIGNVGDNFQLYGLQVCPDLDTIMYLLAGILDRKRGWGVKRETFNMLKTLRKYGVEAWFRLGDRDLATHLYRTWLMALGLTLSEVTRRLAEALHVKARIIPATNSPLQTYIKTAEAGAVHLQEFWVKMKAKPRVLGVEYRGASKAKPAPGVVQAIEKAEAVIIPPANPVTSIGPTLAIPAVKEALKQAEGVVVAVSPLTGGKPFSGPAGKLMKGLGMKVSTLTIAQLYQEFLSLLVVDRADARFKRQIEALGVECLVTSTRMSSLKDEKRLAGEILNAAGIRL
ncbi:MAG: 2-phospho-L-lactate transferase [Candidatus Hecatellaceae archaeon]